MDIPIIVRKIRVAEFEERRASRQLEHRQTDRDELREKVRELRSQLRELYSRLYAEVPAVRQRRINELQDLIRRTTDPHQVHKYEIERERLVRELETLDVAGEIKRLLQKI